jgi:hypothetical protein
LQFSADLFNHRLFGAKLYHGGLFVIPRGAIPQVVTLNAVVVHRHG